jgi:choline monooxygenase
MESEGAGELAIDGVSLADRQGRELLPARAFLSPAFYAAELKYVFERSWVHVADLPDLTKPGDYVSAQIGRVPVLVVRSESGMLRGFVNACRHRGATLAEGSGNCGKHLRCPYHAWTYTTDGRLAGVPYREEFRGELDGLGLLPIRIATAGPLVFGCLDEQAEPFEHYAGELPEVLRDFGTSGMETAFTLSYELPVNWKVYVENALDGYHIQFVHDLLPQMLGRMFEGAHAFGRNGSASQVPLDVALFGSLLGSELASAHDYARFGFLLPNFVPVLTPFELNYLRVDPLGPESIRLVGRSFDRGGAAQLTRELRKNAFDRTNQQDVEVVTRVQRGLSGERLPPFVYAETLEQRIGHFEQMLLRELRQGLQNDRAGPLVPLRRAS